jgi:hypothetical protein
MTDACIVMRRFDSAQSGEVAVCLLGEYYPREQTAGLSTTATKAPPPVEMTM